MRQSTGTAEKCTLRVPRHLVGRIIGKRGQTIKELREKVFAAC